MTEKKIIFLTWQDTKLLQFQGAWPDHVQAESTTTNNNNNNNNNNNSLLIRCKLGCGYDQMCQTWKNTNKIPIYIV